MDMKKMGSFLKELRKDRDLTQEQLAEIVNVSGRTVSRWETGSNLPDLDVLIELADMYDVDIRELLDGERKSEKVDQETKDTLKKVADYAEAEKKRVAGRMCKLTLGAMILFGAAMVLRFSGLEESVSIYRDLSDFALGATMSVLLLNLLYSAGVLDKIREKKISQFAKNRK